MLVGAVVGAVVASLIEPRVLAWYNEPGNFAPGKQVETLCNLPELIRYASSRLMLWQLIGAGVGALLFLFPGIGTVRRRAAAVAAPTSSVAS